MKTTISITITKRTTWNTTVAEPERRVVDITPKPGRNRRRFRVC